MSQSRPNSLQFRWIVWIVTPLVLLALWPSCVSLIRFWIRIKDYQFGMLVAIVCVAWLCVLAKRNANTAVRPAPWAVAVLVSSLIAWQVAYLANSDMVQQLLIPAVLFLTILAAAGYAAARTVAEPIAALYLTLPWWDYLLPTLQRVTVIATEGLLQIFGIPAIVKATTITILEGSFEIAEGCAGKNYFIVSVTLAILAGAFGRLARRDRIVLVVAAAALALATNWLRVIVIVVAGHLTNMQHYLVAREHITFGTMLFAVPVLLVALIARRLARRVLQPSTASAVMSNNVSQGSLRRQRLWLAMSALPLVIPLAGSRVVATDPGAVTLASLPLLASDWQGPLPPDPQWRPAFVGAADDARVAYRSSAGTVEVYANVYGSQRPGRELISYDNSLMAPGQWLAESQSTLVVDHDNGGFSGLNVRLVTHDADSWVIAYVYRIGGHAILSDGMAQIGYGTLRLFDTPASGLLALAARCHLDCEQSRILVTKFSQQHGNELLASIPSRYSRSVP